MTAGPGPRTITKQYITRRRCRRIPRWRARASLSGRPRLLTQQQRSAPPPRPVEQRRCAAAAAAAHARRARAAAGPVPRRAVHFAALTCSLLALLACRRATGRAASRVLAPVPAGLSHRFGARRWRRAAPAVGLFIHRRAPGAPPSREGWLGVPLSVSAPAAAQQTPPGLPRPDEACLAQARPPLHWGPSPRRALAALPSLRARARERARPTTRGANLQSAARCLWRDPRAEHHPARAPGAAATLRLSRAQPGGAARHTTAVSRARGRRDGTTPALPPVSGTARRQLGACCHLWRRLPSPAAPHDGAGCVRGGGCRGGPSRRDCAVAPARALPDATPRS